MSDTTQSPCTNASSNDGGLDAPHSSAPLGPSLPSIERAPSGEEASGGEEMPNVERAGEEEGSGKTGAASVVTARRAQPSAAVMASKQSNKAVLEREIEELRAQMCAKAGELAARFGKKKSHLQQRMFFAGVVKHKRKPSGWNHFVGRKTREYNQGRPRSEHLTTPKYIMATGNAVCAEWAAMPERERKAWGVKAVAAHATAEMSLTTRRPTNRSVMKDAYATIDGWKDEMKCLSARTGTEIILIAVKSDANHFQIPQYFVTQKASKFLVNKLGMDIDTLANKVEVQVLSMTDDNVVTTKTSRLKTLRSSARELITDGLNAAVRLADRLPRSGDVKMNFPNYEEKIVMPYGVELVGWPTGVPFVNPGGIHRVAELESLCRAIKAEECVWQVLDVRQWNRRQKAIEDKAKGAVAAKGKVSASKKGGKKGKGVTKSVEIIEDSDEEDVGDEVTCTTPSRGKENDAGGLGTAVAEARPSQRTSALQTSLVAGPAGSNTPSSSAPSIGQAGAGDSPDDGADSSHEDATAASRDQLAMASSASDFTVFGGDVLRSDMEWTTGVEQQMGMGTRSSWLGSTGMEFSGMGMNMGMGACLNMGMGVSMNPGMGTDMDLMGMNVDYDTDLSGAMFPTLPSRGDDGGHWSLFGVGMGGGGAGLADPLSGSMEVEMGA